MRGAKIFARQMRNFLTPEASDGQKIARLDSNDGILSQAYALPTVIVDALSLFVTERKLSSVVE
jgi:hypothetical protein